MFASGVILSGATTSSSLFFRLSPVSFYLAQCDARAVPKIKLEPLSILVTLQNVNIIVQNDSVSDAIDLRDDFLRLVISRIMLLVYRV
jgi:hypothetical protein